MAVTIRDVASRAGVAVGTVSRVINNQPDVNPKLREKVQRALRELNYRPNARAQIFARNSSPVVSFILSNRDFLHPFHSRVLQGVEEYCEESGFFVIYTRFRYSPSVASADLQLPTVLQSHGIADCVILAGANFENFTTSLDNRGLPYVLLANNFVSSEPAPSSDRVRFDDFTGAVEATRYLLALGHKDIFFIGDVSLPWYRNRYEGYCKAMKDAGAKPSAQTLGLSDNTFFNGLKSIAMALEQKLPITAVLAGNDDIAHGVWEGLLKAGLDVPRDVSLIGFDDQHGLGRLQSLTSVRVEATEVGRQLAKMAIEKIRSKGIRAPEVLLPTNLIKRETCRPLFQVDQKLSS
ncbi:MAG TPA: LacI family DNA-binding transcriptional regulator [Candidatus Sulfotelmatobacter sp.]|nr:LacI family DNA-binding transcriptional regulator [Candidatus Sulfotelmatobacter sp.]